MADEQLVVVHNPDRPDDGWRPLCPAAAELISLERRAAGLQQPSDPGRARRLRGLIADFIRAH